MTGTPITLHKVLHCNFQRQQCTNSILVKIHFGCIPFWLHSILSTFHFGPRMSFWVKIDVILWICPALQAVLSFSAWEKSLDSTHNTLQICTVLIVSSFHCSFVVRFTFNNKCKPYSKITVESRTQLKTVKIKSNIFAVQPKTRGHVEDLTYLLFLIHLCLSHITYEWMISIQIQHQVQKFKCLKLRFKFWKSLYNMKKLVDKNQ